MATYLHHDILGSAQSGTNLSGVVQWREQYSPFGEELQGISANTDQAGYTGHIRDAATGLSYMQARYYDPVIGRFYSNDPVGWTLSNPVMSFNRYLYVNNNPYKYKDPDGEFFQALIGAAVGFTAEVITQVATTGGVNDWGEVALQTGIGAISGGTGGAAGKLASKAIGALTKPASAMGNGASKVLTEGLSGAVSGGVTGATNDSLNQLAETGTIDGGQVLEAAGKGAVLGSISGGTSGQFQANAAQKTLGNSRAQTMFTSTQPGATAGNVAGNSVNAITSVADTVATNCNQNGGC